MRFYSKYFILMVIGMSFVFFLLSFWFFSSTKRNAWHHTLAQTQDNQNILEFNNMQNGLRMLQSLDFEVFGRVQGVFFRKFTREKGKELGLKGWVMNTSQGTVLGTMQGKEEKIEDMKHWLQNIGSPMSKIEKCDFKNLRHISKEEFEDFHIKN
ncbi:acylphosphatase-2-like isoform X2 [Uloborus diversus]|uniref:acylphosphatase-2-like isoform X2 n=1 Tax=Uloborus diversus TaxID=327109 RepID=UPI0024099425|nr:acylphosphatase-2-like isoform X2 [Uloborus diversus]